MFNREDDAKANFAEIMKGRFDPQEMIDKMASSSPTGLNALLALPTTHGDSATTPVPVAT